MWWPQSWGLDQLEWLRNYCKRYRLVSQLKRLIYWEDIVMGKLFPVIKMSFQSCWFHSPNLEECGGFFLDSGKKFYMDFKGVNGKTLYKLCVKCFNKKALNRKIDTPWRTVLGLDEVFMTNWKTFYKPPLIKKIGDLQWRILHCIIAVNALYLCWILMLVNNVLLLS